MKATIAGTRYNTQKAVFIGTGTNLGSHRWSEWIASLYRSPNSAFYFLAGEGGRMTIFAAHGPHGLEYGERILPVSRADAREFASLYLARGTIEVETLFVKHSAIEEVKAHYRAGQFPTP